MVAITTLGFDADDTLWHNEKHFHFTQSMFADLLKDHASPETIAAKLLSSEKKNLAFYGFGIKGFTLSMIETAIDVTEGKVPASTLKALLNAGRDMLHQPVELLPHAQTTLAALAADYRLILITKGDLFDQERKVAQSGLGEYFHGVEIVSDKSPKTYQNIFTAYGADVSTSLMVGNSLRSDVIPALEAGAWGVFVPHELTWGYEHAEPPQSYERFRQISDLGQLQPLLATL